MASKSAAAMLRWKKEPWTFVRQVFKVEPHEWQDEILHAAADNMYLAACACKGPGKTCVLAWLCLWFLFCFKKCNIAAISITADNLRDGLWKEMGKWMGRSGGLFDRDFEMTARAIKRKTAPHNWWIQARPFSKSADANAQANSLAGLHEDDMMIAMDEVSDYPKGLVATAEAAMGTVGGRKLMVAMGNPTDPNGPLGDIFLRQIGHWYTVNITGDPDDPKRSPQVSLEWAKQQIEKYGRDNPWVLVNVFGKFPPSAINSLIGLAQVEEAFSRRWDKACVARSQKRIGVDVARYGDDRSVIYRRQGLFVHKPEILRNMRGFEIADVVCHEANAWGHSPQVFVDETGGWGAGVMDALIQRGMTPIGVQFSGKPLDPRYKNKRAEIWFEMIEWIKRGGTITPTEDLAKEISDMTYTHQQDKLLLERKDQFKQRTGYSPDLADALALTFATPEVAGNAMGNLPGSAQMRYDYDPLAEDD